MYTQEKCKIYKLRLHILKNGGQKILSLFFCAFGCIGPILLTALRSIFLTKRFFSFNIFIFIYYIIHYIFIIILSISSFIIILSSPNQRKILWKYFFRTYSLIDFDDVPTFCHWQLGNLLQSTHFWVCITFCKVRHGDGVTKPDYYYYYYYLLLLLLLLLLKLDDQSWSKWKSNIDFETLNLKFCWVWLRSLTS